MVDVEGDRCSRFRLDLLLDVSLCVKIIDYSSVEPVELPVRQISIPIRILSLVYWT